MKMKTPTATDEHYLWNGCWTLDSTEIAHAYCLWFIAYRQLSINEFAGCVCGYSGGGSFEFEQFYVCLDGARITKCVIDDIDRVTDEEEKEIQFNCAPVQDEHLKSISNTAWGANDCFDQLHIHDGWFVHDQQFLLPSAILEKDLILLSNGRFVGGTSVVHWLKDVIEYIGLAAGPTATELSRPRADAVKQKGRFRAQQWIAKLEHGRKQLQAMWSES